MRRVVVVLGLLISFAASNPSLSGIRWDWTAEEVACAQTIDVKLGTAANPDSPTFVSYLTWLSDAVVIGRVTEIRHSLQGDFPTIVVVSVDLVRKGENIPATLEIVQNGGPHFSTTYQQIVTLVSTNEPDFVVGEQAFLFLSGNTATSAAKGREEKSLAANQFTLVDGAKFTIVNSSGAATATYNTRIEVTLSVASINSQIDRARTAQKTLCH